VVPVIVPDPKPDIPIDEEKPDMGTDCVKPEIAPDGAYETCDGGYEEVGAYEPVWP
jgi:hypothetical protein